MDGCLYSLPIAIWVIVLCAPCIHSGKQTLIPDNKQQTASRLPNRHNLVIEYDLYASTKLALSLLTLLSSCALIPMSIMFIIQGMVRRNHLLRLITGIIAILPPLILLGLFVYVNSKPKIYITCQSDKITIQDTVVPLQNIEFVTITFLGKAFIKSIQIHMKNPSGIYTLESHRMKNLLSMLKLIDFLEDREIDVIYSA